MRGRRVLVYDGYDWNDAMILISIGLASGIGSMMGLGACMHSEGVSQLAYTKIAL